MRCNTKQKLIGKQTAEQVHKISNGKYDWNPETTEFETAYYQYSICKRGHKQGWTSRKPFTTIKWLCNMPIKK
tara:strand:- start:597 stop:815 length:219 start_codon:yes stop_codon:yes gene_type:complete